jgi:competence protein ComEA
MIRFAIALLAAMFGFDTPIFATEMGAETADQYVLAQAKAGEMIDINRAKAEELMTLKGIGEARAKAIIKGRPYKRKDELVQKNIVPESVYDGIKDQIIAKQ